MFSTDAFVAKRSAEIIRRAMEKFVLDLLHSFVPVIIHQHGPPHALNDYTERKACPHCWRQALIVLSHRDDTISKAEIRGTSPGRVGTKVRLKIFKKIFVPSLHFPGSSKTLRQSAKDNFSYAARRQLWSISELVLTSLQQLNSFITRTPEGQQNTQHDFGNIRLIRWLRR